MSTTMQDILGFDPISLMFVNAVSLVAFGLAFFFAWLKHRDKSYWLLWMWANIVLACSLYLFSAAAPDSVSDFAYANCALVLGLALRWQAVRKFFNRKLSLFAPLVAVLIVALLYQFPQLTGYGFIFAGINALIVVQICMIIYELLADRSEPLPSRWGLVFVYAIVGLSSVFRIQQGLTELTDMPSLMPHDTLLTAHLLIATIHIAASGAFVISMAYERGIFELKQMVLRDPLTDLFNRRAFELSLERLKPSGERIALIIIDIDYFKQVNDAFGHAAGDMALKRCAGLLKSIFRKGDFIARIGGEEFVVLLPDTTLNEAYELAERTRKLIEADSFDYDGHVVRVTISAGVCQAEPGVISLADITGKADKGLYSAKEKGRNRVEVVTL